MRRYLDATSLHQHVADVRVGRDYVLKGTGPERLPEELMDLYKAIRRVLKTSIERGSDARDLPSDYLILHRGEGEACPRCSAEICRIKTGQRSTYFCPECQPRRD